MVFLDYERFEVSPTNDSFNNIVKNNIPYDAIVAVSFFGDGNGSRIGVFSRDNFSSNDVKIYHNNYRSPADLSNPNIGTFDQFTMVARKGSDIGYDAANFGANRVDIVIHLLYLPEAQ